MASYYDKLYDKAIADRKQKAAEAAAPFNNDPFFNQQMAWSDQGVANYGKQADQYENMSSDFMNALQQSAMGTTPGVAGQQLMQNGMANNRAAMAAAVSQRPGMSGGTAQRLVTGQIGNMNAQVNQQAQIQNLQEQKENQTLYAQALAQAQSEAQALMQLYMNRGYNAQQAQTAAMRQYELAKMGISAKMQQAQAQQDAALLNTGVTIASAFLK
jgi:hypothetical protein